MFCRVFIFFQISLLGFFPVQGQQFLNKGMIEFEVKTNVQKTIGEGTWGMMLKENLPNFKTGYYEFLFSGAKSLYRFSKWAESPKIPEFMRRDDEQHIYFMDHRAGKMYQQKMVIGSNFYVEDSIPSIRWRLTNESRVIAGFNCRKAVGIIMDSVYIFAFYTDEIMISGGPCSINGLPGMILGLTIPRLYVSFIATKVSLIVPVEEIKPVSTKKFSKRSDLQKIVTERAKEWSSDEDENSKKWRDQFLWNAML